MSRNHRDDNNMNPNSYDHLYEQINSYNMNDPSHQYLFMQNPPSLWNSTLSPQDILLSQRTSPSSISTDAMPHDNLVNMHSPSNYPLQNHFTDLENHSTPFLRSSSDLGLRMNHFTPRETPQFTVENLTSNIDLFNSSMLMDANPGLIQNHSVASMPSLPQEYQTSEFSVDATGHPFGKNPSFEPCSQQSTDPQPAAIDRFATKLSLGTWVSPLQPIGNDYHSGNQSESSSMHMGNLPDFSRHSNHHHLTVEPTPFSSSTGRIKKSNSTTKPSYSDVLSKKASQECKGSLNGFQTSYSKSKQNNLLLEPTPGAHKPRNEHKPAHTKKGKNSSNVRSSSPSAHMNFSNVNTFNHGNKENSYSKVGLDHFDIPESASNPKNSPHYNAYRNNLNCPSKNCNLDFSAKALKKVASHSSPNHSKRSSSPKEIKKSVLKQDEPSSVSDGERIVCDQLNNHVPFSQQRQTPKRTSFINNNLSSSGSNLGGIKTTNSNCLDSTQTKSGGGVFAKEDIKPWEDDCSSTHTKFPSSDLHGCSSSISSSRCSLSTSRGSRPSNIKDRNKDTQGKRNNIKKKKETASYKHSEILNTGWTLLLVWIGVAAKAGLWLLFLFLDVVRMSSHLLIHLCLHVLSWSKLQCVKLKMHSHHYWTSLVSYIFKPKKENKRQGRSDRKSSSGLETNIPLPTTGEEAMKRLLACRGKDPYSILGVTKTCTDDDIKKYYKRQAFLVHPDKNKQPGAEEAFKILAHAFEIIGEPERRIQYDNKLAEEVQFEGAWGEMASLLTRLKEKIEEAANTIRCTNCNRRHRRVKLPRPIYAARHCADCQIKHAAREGDIWAESWFFGLRWRYFACMEGAIYDISEWAACQRENLKHLQANTHSVQYRIVSGKKNSNSKNNVPECPTDPELEDFFNKLCREGFRNDFVPGQTTSTSTSDSRKRKGKKKK